MDSCTVYSADDVAEVQQRIAEDLAAWRVLRRETDAPALMDVESAYCRGLALHLELAFVGRARSQEGADGNALNELRMIARSLLEGDGLLLDDATVAYSSERAVLGIAVGDPIVLDPDGIERLTGAVLNEIRARFV